MTTSSEFGDSDLWRWRRSVIEVVISEDEEDQASTSASKRGNSTKFTSFLQLVQIYSLRPLFLNVKPTVTGGCLSLPKKILYVFHDRPSAKWQWENNTLANARYHSDRIFGSFTAFEFHHVHVMLLYTAGVWQLSLPYILLILVSDRYNHRYYRLRTRDWKRGHVRA